MSYNNVRSYTDKELLDRVKSLLSFETIPSGHWILGVRSNEDASDVNDDKFYIFKGEEFVMVMPGSTNPGKYGLLNWRKWSSKGAAIIKADEWYYSVWKRGLHKGKMEALLQVGEFKVVRDNDMDLKSEDDGNWTWERNKGLNFHTQTYNTVKRVIRKFIGLWNVGCQTPSDSEKYYEFLRKSKPQKKFTYCLINEF